MPSEGQTKKRTVSADPVHNNTVVTKLVGQIMLDGKKSIARKIVYGASERTRERTDKELVEVFEAAMNNVIPVFEIKAGRIDGATYQVSIKVKPGRRQAFASCWFASFPRTRGEKTQEERLTAELMDIVNNAGSVVKRKEDIHKMAETDKVFTHYRF